MSNVNGGYRKKAKKKHTNKPGVIVSDECQTKGFSMSVFIAILRFCSTNHLFFCRLLRRKRLYCHVRKVKTPPPPKKERKGRKLCFTNRSLEVHFIVNSKCAMSKSYIQDWNINLWSTEISLHQWLNTAPTVSVTSWLIS